jgi:hypothetical protein
MILTIILDICLIKIIFSCDISQSGSYKLSLSFISIAHIMEDLTLFDQGQTDIHKKYLYHLVIFMDSMSILNIYLSVSIF